MNPMAVMSVAVAAGRLGAAARAGDVDPKQAGIDATFGNDPQDGSWPWALHSKDSFPTTEGMPKYPADKRTCVLPVRPEPGKTSAIWANSGTFGNFKDPEGRSAVPSLLVFRTGE